MVDSWSHVAKRIAAQDEELAELRRRIAEKSADVRTKSTRISKLMSGCQAPDGSEARALTTQDEPGDGARWEWSGDRGGIGGEADNARLDTVRQRQGRVDQGMAKLRAIMTSTALAVAVEDPCDVVGDAILVPAIIEATAALPEMDARPDPAMAPPPMPTYPTREHALVDPDAFQGPS